MNTQLGDKTNTGKMNQVKLSISYFKNNALSTDNSFQYMKKEF